MTEQPLSKCFETATGIAAGSIAPEHFKLLMGALEQLPATSRDRNLWLKEIRIYYRALQTLSKSCQQALPALANRAREEAVACAKYAAAVLDQRLNAQMVYASRAQE